MAWLSPPTWAPNDDEGPLTHGVLIYLVPFDTMTFLTLPSTVQYSSGGGGSGGTRGYGFAA